MKKFSQPLKDTAETLVKFFANQYPAYDSPSNIKMPDDLLKVLSKRPETKKSFETLNKANTSAIALRLQTAQNQKSGKSVLMIMLEMLSKQEKFH